MNNVYVKLYGPHSIMMSFSNPGLINGLIAQRYDFITYKKSGGPQPPKGGAGKKQEPGSKRQDKS